MIQLKHPIERPNVTHLIADELRHAIAHGQIAAGTSINEVRLARSLHVSRTPLREALMHLAAEGAVKSIPRRGFFVRELSVSEFENLYAIRAVLDPEALKLSGLPDKRRLKGLELLNRKLVNANSAAQRVALDNEWHTALVASCPNHILLGLIRQFMARTRRYEMALLREQGNVRVSASEHKRIIAALRAANLRAACAALRDNMRSGHEAILHWLQNRSEDKR